jgi:hypothetical protein
MDGYTNMERFCCYARDLLIFLRWRMRLRFGKGGIVPHPEFTVLLAALLATILGLTGDRSARERLYYGSYVFLAAMVTVIAGSWAMRVIEM